MGGMAFGYQVPNGVDISVDPIFNNGDSFGATVTFTVNSLAGPGIPQGTISGTLGHISAGTAYDVVNITNNSDKKPDHQWHLCSGRQFAPDHQPHCR